jgi:CTP:phosphocholine cytidylyltransferase-like protein
MPRKFKKVYIVVEDNYIFSKHNYFSIETFNNKEAADRICNVRQQEALKEAQMHHAKNKTIPQFKVHGFYLVHESLF